MKKILPNTICALSLLSGFAAGNPALAQQKSNYSAFVGGGYSQYKDIYNLDNNFTHDPDGVVLTTFHSDIALDKIKVFLPPGTKKLIADFTNYLSPEEAKAAVRFNALPTSAAAEVTAETGLRQLQGTLESLVAKKEELRFYTPGGSGFLAISKPYSFDTYQTDQGGYIYLHLLSMPGGVIKTLQTRLSVDEDCYRSWFAHAQWDAHGNPKEGVTHTCSGSSDGIGSASDADVGSLLPALAVSPSIWQVGTVTANQPITVTLVNHPGAVLPSCTASSPLLTLAQASDGTQAQFSVDTAAVTTATDVSISCGSGTEAKTATVHLLPAAIPQTIVQKYWITNVRGKGELAATFSHTETEYAASPKASYWVRAKVPANPPSFPQEEWFVLAAKATGGAEWQLWNPANPDAQVFLKDAPINEYSKTSSFKAPLQFAAEQFRGINAKIYLSYRHNGGELHDMGMVWDSTNYSRDKIN